jgi:hypothetical protein
VIEQFALGMLSRDHRPNALLIYVFEGDARIFIVGPGCAVCVRRCRPRKGEERRAGHHADYRRRVTASPGCYRWF